MSVCINKNTAEFQTLLKQSGLPEFYIAGICSQFLEQYDRFPYLDEIDGADSSKYIQEQLNMKHGAAKIEKILEMTGTNSLEEAQININNIFRDVEVEIIPLTNTAKINITKRPTLQPRGELVEHSLIANPKLIYENTVNKLQSYYNSSIQIIYNDEAKKLNPKLVNMTQFSHEGQLFINPSYMSMKYEVPMALLMSDLQRQPFYMSLLEKTEGTPVLKNLIELYPERSIIDLQQEALIEYLNRLAKFNIDSLHLPGNMKHEIMYHIRRTLDSILMGDISVKGFSNVNVFNKSLEQLCELTNSSLDAINYVGTNLDDIFDAKEKQLIENGELMEYCHV